MAAKRLWRSILLLVLALGTAAGAAAQSVSPADLADIDEAWSIPTDYSLKPGPSLPFTPPPESTIPDDAFGLMVKRGLAIFTNTTLEAKPYAGNGLNCSNCHLDRGRRANAAPMWGAWVVYPQFRSKNERVNTITMRIQGCFRFSMNGTAPSGNSDIIVALQSYLFWMAEGAPTGAHLVGAGYPALEAPAEAPSIERGAAVFTANCAACHGADGQGRRASDLPRYQFPPLWGADSYNWGAGMASVNTAAGFIRTNMPWGLQDALTVQQAWDVAMFIDSRERPQDPRFTGDLAETRQRFHNSTWSFYGTRQDGVLLGDPANYPLAKP